MNFLHTKLPDDSEEKKEGDMSDDTLAELRDDLDEEDDLDEAADFDVYDNIDEF